MTDNGDIAELAALAKEIERLNTERAGDQHRLFHYEEIIAADKKRLAEYENEIRDLRLELQRCRESKDRLYATIEKLEDEHREPTRP